MGVVFFDTSEKNQQSRQISLESEKKKVTHIAIKNTDIKIQLKIIITKTIQSLEQQKKTQNLKRFILRD